MKWPPLSKQARRKPQPKETSNEYGSFRHSTCGREKSKRFTKTKNSGEGFKRRPEPQGEEIRKEVTQAARGTLLPPGLGEAQRAARDHYLRRARRRRQRRHHSRHHRARQPPRVSPRRAPRS